MSAPAERQLDEAEFVGEHLEDRFDLGALLAWLGVGVALLLMVAIAVSQVVRWWA